MRKLAQKIDLIEETIAAYLLAAMVGVTFTQVIARYVFNAGAVWALEATVFLFAWMVLLGMSWVLKHVGHLGVDALVNIMPRRWRVICTLVSLLGCLVYAALLFKGATDYWSKFYFKINLEVEDIPWPHWIQDLFGQKNGNDYKYETMPRYVAYFVLPFGLGLLILRSLVLGWQVVTGERQLIIANHEVEEAIAEAGAVVGAAETTKQKGH